MNVAVTHLLVCGMLSRGIGGATWGDASPANDTLYSFGSAYPVST